MQHDVSEFTECLFPQANTNWQCRVHAQQSWPRLVTWSAIVLNYKESENAALSLPELILTRQQYLAIVTALAQASPVIALRVQRSLGDMARAVILAYKSGCQCSTSRAGSHSDGSIYSLCDVAMHRAAMKSDRAVLHHANERYLADDDVPPSYLGSVPSWITTHASLLWLRLAEGATSPSRSVD